MKNNTAKKYLILCIIITVVFTITIGIVTNVQMKNYTNKLNNKIAEIIGEVKTQYPEIQEENIIDSNICTVCNSNLMHSYRKDGKNAGRNTAIIGLRK